MDTYKKKIQKEKEDSVFNKKLAWLIVAIIAILLMLILLNSCSKGEIVPEEPSLRVISTKVGHNGQIKGAQVMVSPLLKRFAYITYEIVGINDGLEGDVVFREFFSDTIDLKYNENIVGDRTFVMNYEGISGTYHIYLKDGKVVPLDYEWN